MKRTIALLAFLAIPVLAVDFSLKGTWKATSAQLWSCEGTAPVLFEHFRFTIEDAPVLNLRSASSFRADDVTVTGDMSLTMTVKQDDWLRRLPRDSTDPVERKLDEMLILNAPPLLVNGFGGKLSGELIRNLKIGSGSNGKTAGLGLKGYLIGGSTRWPDGEVELEVSGNAFRGYTLTGIMRSGQTCSENHRVDPAVREWVDRFGHGLPSRWAVRVTLKKQ